MKGIKYTMGESTEDGRAELTRKLQQEFASGPSPENTTVQRYSESTKTLYADEEEAKRRIASNSPEITKENEKKELTVDEMFRMLADEKKAQQKPLHKGYAAVTEQEGKWHS